MAGRRGSGGAAAGPLAGERAHPSGSAPPSSGLTAVLEPAHPIRDGPKRAAARGGSVPAVAGALVRGDGRRAQRVSPPPFSSWFLGF